MNEFLYDNGLRHERVNIWSRTFLEYGQGQEIQ